MKRTLLIAVGLLAIAGCNNPRPAVLPVAGTTAATEAAPETAAACPEETGYKLFPEAMKLAIPYHLRGDRIYVHKNGQQRRRVTVEFLEGDVGTALAAFEQSMVTAGFKAGPRNDGADGKITMPFSKKGFGTAHVSAMPTVGPKPSNPDAKGVISIDYPMGAAPPRP